MNHGTEVIVILEECISIEHRIIFHDPTHRYYTAQRFCCDPSGEQLLQHWYEGGGASAYYRAVCTGTFQRPSWL